ncbi:hypothetical protein H9P43_009963 [Blastocladiella emersonii ATCC 22665]|nr:hypothetical protein H9P43_009963 [Blastocladiella emersonii ATCC 22665]
MADPRAVEEFPPLPPGIGDATTAGTDDEYGSTLVGGTSSASLPEPEAEDEDAAHATREAADSVSPLPTSNSASARALGSSSPVVSPVLASPPFVSPLASPTSPMAPPTAGVLRARSLTSPVVMSSLVSSLGDPNHHTGPPADDLVHPPVTTASSPFVITLEPLAPPSPTSPGAEGGASSSPATPVAATPAGIVHKRKSHSIGNLSALRLESPQEEAITRKDSSSASILTSGDPRRPSSGSLGSNPDVDTPPLLGSSIAASFSSTASGPVSTTPPTAAATPAVPAIPESLRASMLLSGTGTGINTGSLTRSAADAARHRRRRDLSAPRPASIMVGASGSLQPTHADETIICDTTAPGGGGPTPRPSSLAVPSAVDPHSDADTDGQSTVVQRGRAGTEYSESSSAPPIPAVPAAGAAGAGQQQQTKLQRRFARHFPALVDEVVYSSYHCAMEKEENWVGRLYLTDRHLCFQGKLNKYVAKVTIHWGDVIRIQPRIAGGSDGDTTIAEHSSSGAGGGGGGAVNAIKVMSLASKYTLSGFTNAELPLLEMKTIWQRAMDAQHATHRRLDLLLRPLPVPGGRAADALSNAVRESAPAAGAAGTPLSPMPPLANAVVTSTPPRASSPAAMRNSVVLQRQQTAPPLAAAQYPMSSASSSPGTTPGTMPRSVKSPPQPAPAAVAPVLVAPDKMIAATTASTSVSNINGIAVMTHPTATNPGRSSSIPSTAITLGSAAPVGGLVTVVASPSALVASESSPSTPGGGAGAAAAAAANGAGTAFRGFFARIVKKRADTVSSIPTVNTAGSVGDPPQASSNRRGRSKTDAMLAASGGRPASAGAAVAESGSTLLFDDDRVAAAEADCEVAAVTAASAKPAKPAKAYLPGCLCECMADKPKHAVLPSTMLGTSAAAVWNAIFGGDAAVYRAAHGVRESENLEIEPWGAAPAGMPAAGAARTLNYRVAYYLPFKGKQTTDCTESQKLVAVAPEAPGGGPVTGFVVDYETKAPGAPYGSSFVTQARVCVHQSAPNETTVHVLFSVNFLQRVRMMEGKIEGSGVDGCAALWKEVVNGLQALPPDPEDEEEGEVGGAARPAMSRTASVIEEPIRSRPSSRAAAAASASAAAVKAPTASAGKSTTATAAPASSSPFAFLTSLASALADTSSAARSKLVVRRIRAAKKRLLVLAVALTVANALYAVWVAYAAVDAIAARSRPHGAVIVAPPPLQEFAVAPPSPASTAAAAAVTVSEAVVTTLPTVVVERPPPQACPTPQQQQSASAHVAPELNHPVIHAWSVSLQARADALQAELAALRAAAASVVAAAVKPPPPPPVPVPVEAQAQAPQQGEEMIVVEANDGDAGVAVLVE